MNLQTETFAIYPFLATPNLNLNSPAAQTGLNAFISSVYTNLFGHGADVPGQNYWVAQITGGTVGLGAAALAIANGATSGDAIALLNRITVARDFTTRTSAAFGVTNPSDFKTTAASVLKPVDGASLNDASVTAAENATSTYIAAAASVPVITKSAVAPDEITVTDPNQLVDPGVGDFTIRFLPGATGETLVPRAGGQEQVSGFDPASDVLDFRSLLTGGQRDALAQLHVSVSDQGADAVISFDPTGQGGGTPIAVLHGMGQEITNLGSLLTR